MLISNISFINNFKGFKDFVYDTDLSDNEKCFVDYLRDSTLSETNNINGKKEIEETDKFIPAAELKNYDIIDVYGDIYRDKKYKNEVFLKLRIKPTPNGIEIIKRGAFDEKAKAEIVQNPLITEFVSQPIPVRSKSAYSDIVKHLNEKLAFFKNYISGTSNWKTSTKGLLKPSDKPKYQWDKDLIVSMIYVGKN